MLNKGERIMHIATLFSLLITISLAIGIWAILYTDKKESKPATIVYYVMIAISVVYLLLGVWFILWISAWNRSEFGGSFPLITITIALIIQLIMMRSAPKKSKKRKVLGLTLMATPLFIVVLTFLIAGVLDIYIALD